MSQMVETRRIQAASFKYIPDPELIVAAKVAMELGQPLLLTGEPGTGKTTFAHYLATELAPQFFAEQEDTPQSEFGLYSFETKSTSVSTDLFYRFDNLRRFQAAHSAGMSEENRDYITFEALGKAIIESLPWEDVDDLVPDPRCHPVQPRRSVVLIDEVDKAPRDFPNDLLNEIQSHFFRILELTDRRTGSIRRVDAGKTLRPVVILTSNSEKNLPAPFLRRCVFHHIRFPDRAQSNRLTQIIKENLTVEMGLLSSSAVSFFYDIRENLRLDKLPTTHELIQWIRILHSHDWTNDPKDIINTPLSSLPREQLKATLGVIAKTASDRADVAALIDQTLNPKTVAA